MQWIQLTDQAQLSAIDELSKERPVLIFKHSTRCMISGLVLNRLERDWPGQLDNDLPVYFLDLLRHRPLSDAIEARYGVEHASPQVLLIRNGACVHTASHLEIHHADLMEQLG